MPTLSRKANGNIAEAARLRGLASKRNLLNKYHYYTRRHDFAHFMQSATVTQRAVMERYMNSDVTFADLAKEMNQDPSELRALFVKGMQATIEAMTEAHLG